jgi:hypothetical protein
MNGNCKLEGAECEELFGAFLRPDRLWAARLYSRRGSIDLLRGHNAVVSVVGDPQLPMRPHRHTCAGALRHHPRAAPGGYLAGLRPDLAGRRAAPVRRL